MVKKWKIKEATFNSLKELNEYIEENGIEPSSLIKYDTLYETLKQKTRYVITYWSIKE